MLFALLQITIPDVKKVYQLFIDEQRSQKFLKEYEDEFMFDEGKARYCKIYCVVVLWVLKCIVCLFLNQ